jgi:tRNA(His) 5'-end guanylyltransferase
MDKTSLGDRMKGYENVVRNVLIRRMPVILRVDGRAFHTLTKRSKFDKPFDTQMSAAMTVVAHDLFNEIQGAKFVYTQSDEVSVLITDYDTLQTDAWFGYNIQKMVSISASIASNSFNEFFANHALEKYRNPIRRAQFDARVFNLPKEEVCNYFIWRQQDATRNSVSMLAQSLFSHNELHGKSCNEMQDMMFIERGINWGALDTWKKRGICVTGNCKVNTEIPIFKDDRDYIEQHVYLTEKV